MHFFRYIAKALPNLPKCGHNNNTLKCATLKLQDIRRFHEQFYKEKTKASQDCLLLKYVKQESIKRRRPTTATNTLSEIRCKYSIPTRMNTTVQVCLKTLIGILNISRFRINILVNNFVKSGEMPRERRGGDRIGNKNETRMHSVMNFLNKLKCSEMHYCTSTTGGRYLPAELNIRTLSKMYNLQNDVPLKCRIFE